MTSKPRPGKTPSEKRGKRESNRHEQGEQFRVSERERGEVEEKLPPSVQVLHETIRIQGTTELSRAGAALGWSALAAGLSMGSSMLARALLRAYLPDVPASFLIENIGYTVGFLVVILARQQLFTENTLTAVLPLMTNPSMEAFGKLLRLWSIVLVGNLVGVSLFAYGLGHTHVLDPPVRAAAIYLGEHVMLNSVPQMFSKGIAAGFLIATMVWMVPGAGNAKVFIIMLMTYLIGIGGFTHIIVGSAEVMFLVFENRISIGDFAVDFALPTLAGNVVGGSLIFALISHAQVRTDEA